MRRGRMIDRWKHLFNAFSATFRLVSGASDHVEAFDVCNLGQIDPSTFNRFAL